LRTRWVLLAFTALLLGALGGTLLAPPPASGVAREIIQLQEQVAQLLQGQQDLRSSVDAKHAELKTLIEQSVDSVHRLSTGMADVQKAMQEVQANSGARIDSLSTQTQGIADNMQDVQARVSKLSQQMSDLQGVLQSIDGKVSGGAAPTSAEGAAPGAPVPGQPVAGGPPVSANVLYPNALRDFNSGNYDLARQEFGDYLKNFPSTDLASNAQFYLGEIDYAQHNYRIAVAEYDRVIANYPRSYKMAASMLKRGDALLALGQKTGAIQEYREVVRRFPGSDEAKHAQAKLRGLGALASPR
jgi:tol-pal system protein YbgF